MALARDNGRRELPIEAPRGDIVDRHDDKLVTTRRAAVVQIVPASLPKAERELGDDYHAALSAAERARIDAETRSKALRAPAARRRPPRDPGGAGGGQAAAQGRERGGAGADPAAPSTGD